ncbi:hypothetical protein GY45DRAFT_1316699 [Cubamyces sp. BRFM 1775]|nr:hypothetical protein GY45DRAFT_1316699 [Cubamyces sp. BRFM 1775]
MAQSFTTISADGRRSMGATTSGFNSEEEIDQLDSGLDDVDEEDDMEPEVEEEESVSTLKGRKKLGVRVPGQTLLPQDKVDNILQAEGAGPHMSKEAVFMLSIATEEFIKKLAEAGYKQTLSDNRQHVQYRDMATLTEQRSEYRFLEDTIPRPMSIRDAMALRAAKERELHEDDPAISAAPPSSPPLMPITAPSATTSISTARAKPKARQSLPAETNGKPKTNGNASASIAGGSASAGPSAASLAARNRVRDSNGRWRKANTANGITHASNTPSVSASTGTRAGSARIRNRSARAREAAEAAENGSHAVHQNGASPHPNGRSASSASLHQDLNASPGSAAQGDRWSASGSITGPASGYLEESNRVSFGARSSMTDNPGRTIYSQQRPPPQPR